MEKSIMKYDIWFADGIARIRVGGHAILEGYTALFFDLVTSPAWMPGMNILINSAGLELSHLSSDDLQEISMAIGRYRKKLGKGKCAILSSNAVEYGVEKILQVWLECDTDLRVGVFYSIGKANRWLSGNKVLDFSAESVVWD